MSRATDLMQNVPASQLSPSSTTTSLPSSLVSAPFAPALAVVGYARVSTDLQREKESIKTQVDLIERYCVERGYKLVETIQDDGVSGTLPLEQRPGGRRLLELCRSGKVAALVVYRADRIGRDVWVNEMAVRELHDQLGVDFQGVAEKIDLSSPIGRAMFTFQSAIAKLEREGTLQRSRDATIRLAREGTWLGGITPFGYRLEGKDREARLRIASEVDPETGMSEADVVRMMFAWSANDGLSSIQIAQRLNDLNIPTSYVRDERLIQRTGNDGYGKRKEKTSGLWRGGRVRNMLVEPTYKGLHVWGRRGSKRRRKDTPVTLVEREVPALVDKATWDGAQLTLARNRIARPDIVKRPYLLRGLMKCSHCGHSFVGTVSQGKFAGQLSREEFEAMEMRGDYMLRPYYMCNGRNLPERRKGPDALNCPSGYLRAKELEALVWGEVEGMLNEPEKVVGELETLLRQRLGEGAGESDLFRELEGLRAEAAGKEGERNALYRLFRKGMLPETDLESQLSELREEEMAIGARLELVEKAVEKAKDARSSLDGARSLLSHMKAKVESDDSWSSRRRAIETLVAGIEVETLATEGRIYGRGRGRAVTLRVSYRFETPGVEELTPAVQRPYSGRLGHTSATVLGLSLTRTHENLNFASDQFANAREAAREIVRANPSMMAKDVIALVFAQTGESISQASVSRLRSGMKQTGTEAAAPAT